jgi:hypothetical protein
LSILTHIVLAKAADGGLLLEHHPARGWPHVNLQSLDDRHLNSLYALLLPPGAARDMDEGEGFHHIPASEPGNPAGPWVMWVPDALVALLADLDEAGMAAAATRWRKSAMPPPPETWSPDAVTTLLAELQPMAQLVRASAATPEPLGLFLWISSSS